MKAETHLPQQVVMSVGSGLGRPGVSARGPSSSFLVSIGVPNLATSIGFVS